MTTNPCFACPGMPPKKTTCKQGNCICFCDIYISPKSELAVPCNTQGIIELATYDKDVSVCSGNTINYELMYFEESFYSDVVLDRDGVLSWIPASGVLQKTGNIIFKISCGGLSKLVTVTIGRKNVCEGVFCPAGMICDECTGLCKPENCGTGDLTITEGTTSIKTQGDVDLTITVR